MDKLENELNELKKDEFPAVDFDYQIKDNGNVIHIYHFEVLNTTRGLGIGSTTMSDIESIASLNKVSKITVKIGLTGDADENNKDSTIAFLESLDYELDEPIDDAVKGEKRVN